MFKMVVDISIFSQKELSNYDVSIDSLLAVPILPLIYLHSCLFNCVNQVAKHYNGENETFCVKCGLYADHFTSLVRVRTKYAIPDFYGSSVSFSFF